jgi:NAD(P)-dependent dehydrogenase (short-subunit alcohol dehydrogenase family)
MAAGNVRSSQAGPVVAVYGATGHTGRFVVAELLRRGFVPVAVARDEAKLAVSGFRERGVATRSASIDAPGSLDRAFKAASAVINCAGPFMDTAGAVAEAALRAGVHYLDVSAEQPSAQDTFERFGDAAREVGVVVVPAMGFYGGLADLLATAAANGWASVDEVRIAVALDSWHPTLGTRITGYRNTARRLMIADARLAPIPQPAPETTWEFPEPFGLHEVIELSFSEVVLIARHLRTSRLHSYINHGPLRDLRDPSTPPPRPPTTVAALLRPSSSRRMSARATKPGGRSPVGATSTPSPRRSYAKPSNASSARQLNGAERSRPARSSTPTRFCALSRRSISPSS